jgi:uncharacterized protein (DUF169 family)
MNDYASLAASLTASLGLRTAPVAIAVADGVPEGMALRSGQAPAGCSFWQDAAQGVFAASAAQHGHCAVGMYTHNLVRTPAEDAELGNALRVFAELDYVRAEDVAKIPVLPKVSKFVLYGPLAEVPFAPEVVLLFVRPSQILVLTEATESVDGRVAPAMGRPACAVVPQAVLSGGAALSLGCCGARAYVDVLADDTALFALPAARLEAYATRLAQLAKANTVLGQFHKLRRKHIEAGESPTIAESLGHLQSSG